MTITENVSLAPLTTFKVGGPARYFTEVSSVDDLREAVSFAREKNLPFFILGGGSNVLISDSGFPGVVIKVSLRGITHEEIGDEIIVTAAAGEVWDEFVSYAAERNWRGLENLSGIPGTVGAAPIQNIGAYGVEVGNLIESLSAVDSENGGEKHLSKEECNFVYRDSFFKSREGKKYIVTSVSFRLSRTAPLSFEYSDLENYFYGRGIEKKDVSLGDLRSAVLLIRADNLPSLDILGTAGCFFKNPLIPLDEFERMLDDFPGTPHFNGPPEMVKIPAGFLVEKSGDFKGMRRGSAGVYDRHALVLINHGSAKAMEVYSLAKEISDAVRKKFGITLEPEVNMIGEF